MRNIYAYIFLFFLYKCICGYMGILLFINIFLDLNGNCLKNLELEVIGCLVIKLFLFFLLVLVFICY